MAPKKTTTEGSDQPQSLTEGELRFIKAVFDNMTQKPDANWDNVAQTLSLKDAKCAKERWRQMSVRHGWREGASGGTSPRKAGASGAAAGGSKVTKKPRAPRKSPAKVKKGGSEEEDTTEIKSEESDEMKPSQEEI